MENVFTVIRWNPIKLENVFSCNCISLQMVLKLFYFAIHANNAVILILHKKRIDRINDALAFRAEHYAYKYRNKC